MANFVPQHPQVPEDRLEDIDLRAWPECERRYLIENMPPEFDEHIFDNDDDDEEDKIDYLDAFAMSTNDGFDIDSSNNGPLANRPPTLLYQNADVSALPAFQVLIRKNIEFFEVKQEDLAVINNMGRKDTVLLGQVGIRCRACSQLPAHQRPTSASFFPTKLDEVFQSAQQMTGSHIIPCCPCLSNDVRAEMLSQLSQCRELARPGDEALWVQRCRELGVFEDQKRLRFSHRINDIPPVDMGDMDFEW
eukprot:scaffold2849_cov174-Amphora_coffeaeformis.AAC.6